VEGIDVVRKLSAIMTAAAAGAGLLMAGGGAAAADTPTAAAHPAHAACSGVIRVDSFAFDPAQITRGGTATASLTATNCTRQSRAVTAAWSGRYSSASSPGIPQGCPAIDPLPRPTTFAPHERATTSMSYLTFSGCLADKLTVTVVITQGGVQLALVKADLAIV
jgi:hypothetical protein